MNFFWILISEYKNLSFTFITITAILSLIFFIKKQRSFLMYILFAFLYASAFFIWFYGYNFYNIVESKICFPIKIDKPEHFDDNLKELSISSIIELNQNNLNEIKNITLKIAQNTALNYKSSNEFYQIQNQNHIKLFQEYYVKLLYSLKEIEKRQSKDNSIDYRLNELKKIKNSFDFRVCKTKNNFKWTFIDSIFEKEL